MNWLENLMNRCTASGIISDIKKQFKNKDIYEIIKNYIEPALDDKNTHITSSSLRDFTISSENNDTSISVEIDTFIDQITYIKISLHIREKNNSDNSDIEYTVEYEISTDKDKEKIIFHDNECKITRNANNVTSKVEIAEKIQTFLDDNLRYEFLSISSKDLCTSSESKHTTMETHINLDHRAVRREINHQNGEHLNIRYLETDNFYNIPFEDLYTIPSLRNNIIGESSEENFNEFIKDGNNLSPIL